MKANTKNTKGSSPMKKLIPAAGMLMISATMLATSTFAWFTMNKEVSVTGMNLQARAEGGILIERSANSATKGISITDPTTVAADAALLPTSTNNASTWFHAIAAANNANTAKAGTMETLTFTDTAPASAALGYKSVTAPDGTTVQKYVLYDTFIVTPDVNASSYQNLWIKNCTVSGASADLSKSLRVAFVGDGGVTICAPVSGANTSYTVGTNADGVTAAGTATTAYDSSATGTTPFTTMTHALETGNALTSETVSVYIYFEGEDTDHYTDHLSNGIENLTITFTLACDDTTAATVAAPAPVGGGD